MTLLSLQISQSIKTLQWLVIRYLFIEKYFNVKITQFNDVCCQAPKWWYLAFAFYVIVYIAFNIYYEKISVSQKGEKIHLLFHVFNSILKSAFYYLFPLILFFLCKIYPITFLNNRSLTLNGTCLLDCFAVD